VAGAETPGDAETGPVKRNKAHKFIYKRLKLLMVSSIKDDMMHSLILLFVKSPERGNVKSRLAATLGEGPALELYKRFVGDMKETLQKGRHPFSICFYPVSSQKKMADWLGMDITYVPQDGDDLGERMKDAFIRSFREGIEKVLIIGSDIPDLENRIMEDAFSSLDNHDAVIGPASDGGYYLLGFKNTASLPGIFQGFPWGTDSVFRKTMTVFKESGVSVHILPERRDMDTLEDLRFLVMTNRETEFRHSQTMSYIIKNKQTCSLIMREDSCSREPQDT
jgi:rSAM/selenodomain-associated transferase 1